MKNLIGLLLGLTGVMAAVSCGSEDPKKKAPYTGSGGSSNGGSKGSGGTADGGSGGLGGKGSGGKGGTTGGSAGNAGDNGAGGDAGASGGNAGAAGDSAGGAAGDSAGGAGGESGDNCPAGKGECDGDPGTVCEADLTLVTSCGDCNTTCMSTNGTVVCQNSACTVTSCAANYGNCDGNGANGCETLLTNDNANCGACGHDCGALGSTCTANKCDEIPLQQTVVPYGSDNGNANTWAFSSSGIYAMNSYPYVVKRLPLDGSAPQTIWSTADKTGGRGSLVVRGTEVFWAERGMPSVVLRKDISAAAGDNPLLAWSQPPPVSPPGQTNQPQFIVVQGNAYYWVNGDYQSGDAAGSVYTRAISASAATPGTPIVSVDQGTHGSITAFTATSDRLYWVTSSAANGTANEIRTTPLAGGTPTPVPAVPGAATTAVYNGYGVALLYPVGDTLYFSRNVDDSFINGIYSFKAADSAPTQLASVENVLSFIVDGQDIYYTVLNNVGVYKAPLAGGAGVQIADNNANKVFGADANFVYAGYISSGNTSLFKVIK